MSKNNKELAAKEAANFVETYGLSLSDILSHLSPVKQVDLAVKAKNGIVRVTYAGWYYESIGKNRGEDIYRDVKFEEYLTNILGIYPMKECDHWLSSHEEYLRGDQVDHHQLPQLWYWAKIHEKLSVINDLLVLKINAPKIEGYYLCRPDYDADGYMVAELFEGKPFKYHTVDQHTPAKVRYVFKNR